MKKGSGFVQHLLAGLKIFGHYAIVVIIGLALAGSFVGVFAENPVWFILYCIAFLLLFTMMAYSEMFNLATRDLRNRNNQESILIYKLKGLVIGAVAAIPLLTATILYLANNWEQNTILKLVYRIIIGLFMAFHIYWANSVPMVYVLILIFIPIVCMLGYLAGLNKYYFSKYFAKLFPNATKKPVQPPKRKY